MLELAAPLEGTRVLDLGCGNGYVAARISDLGATVVGVDPSPEGIELARAAAPGLRFEVGTASRDLLDVLGEAPFDVVVSTEVAAHVYDPHEYAASSFHALRPGGKLILSTPYHGYLKNLALALVNGFDKHTRPLEPHGYLRLWSTATLTQLLGEAGFERTRFVGAGRLPYLWKAIVVRAHRPPIH